MGLSPDLEYLKRCGILEQTMVQFFGSGEAATIFVEGQKHALNLHNQKEPGAWSILQRKPKSIAPLRSGLNAATIEVELYEALPVPSGDVAIDDILEFKERRSDELISLRNHLDDVYQKIISSEDIDRARLTEISKLSKSLNDLHKAYDESISSKILSSVSVEVVVPNLIRETIVCAGLANLFGVPTPLGGAIGAVGAVIKFNSGSVKPESWIPREVKDLLYCYHVSNDLSKVM